MNPSYNGFTYVHLLEFELLEEQVPVPTPEETGQKKPRPKWLSFIIETIQTVVLAVILYIIIDTVVARVRVENVSMLPTLQPGEFLMVSKFAYQLGEPQHGDVIVFHNPFNIQEDFIKRVIGIPGDDVRVQGGKVYVNGQVWSENYIAANPNYDGDWKVPQDTLFVLGDNRNQSSDSHHWGYVPMENVVGKAIVIYWPLTKARVMQQPVVVKANN
jgi:signal peptidase I